MVFPVSNSHWGTIVPKQAKNTPSSVAPLLTGCGRSLQFLGFSTLQSLKLMNRTYFLVYVLLIFFVSCLDFVFEQLAHEEKESDAQMLCAGILLGFRVIAFSGLRPSSSSQWATKAPTHGLFAP